MNDCSEDEFLDLLFINHVIYYLNVENDVNHMYRMGSRCC